MGTWVKKDDLISSYNIGLPGQFFILSNQWEKIILNLKEFHTIFPNWILMNFSFEKSKWGR